MAGALAWSEAVHWVASPESFRELQSKRSAVAHVLPGANQHELQSNLLMAATCAELGGAQVRSLSCTLRSAATSVRLWFAQKEVCVMLRPDAACLKFVEL